MPSLLREAHRLRFQVSRRANCNRKRTRQSQPLSRPRKSKNGFSRSRNSPSRRSSKTLTGSTRPPSLSNSYPLIFGARTSWMHFARRRSITGIVPGSWHRPNQLRYRVSELRSSARAFRPMTNLSFVICVTRYIFQTSQTGKRCRTSAGRGCGQGESPSCSLWTLVYRWRAASRSQRITQLRVVPEAGTCTRRIAEKHPD